MSQNIADYAKEIILQVLDNHHGVNMRISSLELIRIVNQYSRRQFFDAKGCALSNRQMRNLIAELRTETSDGSMICSSLDGGYYMASDLEELEEYLAIDRSRATNMLSRISNQRKHAAERLAGTQKKLL